nr:hypothetical protein [Ochrobactrum sp. LM19]
MNEQPHDPKILEEHQLAIDPAFRVIGALLVATTLIAFAVCAYLNMTSA